MKKNLLVLTLLIGVFSLSFGQTDGKKAINRIGVQGGYSMATFEMIDFDDEEMGFAPSSTVFPAFNAGFFSESGSSPYFTTSIGLYYQKKGYKYEDEIHSLDYIHVPLMLNARLPIAGPVFLKVGLGPYASYAFNGKIKSDDYSSNDIFSFPKKRVEENKFYNPFDLGVSFGGQLEFVLPDSRTIELAIKYDVGIWKISNDLDAGLGETMNFGIKNRVLSFNLVYSFNLSAAE
jgi:hypothetical protein